MAKGAVCVVVCSLVILVLFFVFCYLISTVDPPPLINNVKNDSRRFMDLDKDFSKTIFFNNDFILGEAQYGLEKVKKESDFRLKIDPYDLPPGDKDYEEDIRVPSVTSNIGATTGPIVPIFTVTRAKVFTDTVKKAQYRRSTSNDLEEKNDLGSNVLKVLDESEKSSSGIKLRSNSSVI